MGDTSSFPNKRGLRGGRYFFPSQREGIEGWAIKIVASLARAYRKPERDGYTSTLARTAFRPLINRPEPSITAQPVRTRNSYFFPSQREGIEGWAIKIVASLARCEPALNLLGGMEMGDAGPSVPSKKKRPGRSSTRSSERTETARLRPPS